MFNELHCDSDIQSEFFHQLSQICHNLQSLVIRLYDEASNEMKELINSQNNLKSLSLSIYNNDWSDIIPALTKHSNTLTTLCIFSDYLPSSFISSLSNLQTIILSYSWYCTDFKELQHASFPKLKILKIHYNCLNPMYLVKFLEINGRIICW